MSLKQELDELRAAQKGVSDLVYADLSAQMVLYATSASARSQEAYDDYLNRAVSLLEPKQPATSLAAAIGTKASDAYMLDHDGSALRLYVRAAANPEECLIFGCSGDADCSAIAKAAAECLTRFTGADE